MALPPAGDTIAAIATAPGEGAIGIIRISGPDAFDVADALFEPRSGVKPSLRPAEHIVVGRIVDGGDVIDDAMLLPFRAPRSYTGQDAVELHTHGGPAVLRRVLDACLQHGARSAGPGEFTLRAYLAGKLNLVQAESVLSIVQASSERARRTAAMGLTASLSEALDALQDRVIAALGDVTAVLDYPEEGVELKDVRPALREVRRSVADLLATADASALTQRGARLAIVGQPNAGKSSLLNAMLGYERSIVSDVPGTTRDYLEAPLEIGGVPIVAIDTAGVRTTEDAVEASGVARALDLADHADLVVCLLDRSRPIDDADDALLTCLPMERVVVVASKCDLPAAWQGSDLPDAWGTVYEVSSVDGAGIDALRNAISERLMGNAGSSELWIVHERHAEALRRADAALARAIDAPDDLMALDLQDAVETFAALTGRGDVPEDVLAHVFANFCVGK